MRKSFAVVRTTLLSEHATREAAIRAAKKPRLKRGEKIVVVRIR